MYCLTKVAMHVERVETRTNIMITGSQCQREQTKTAKRDKSV